MKKRLVRPYWQDYVNHMFRLYFRWEKEGRPTPRDQVDKNNLDAVEIVMGKIGKEREEILEKVFKHRMDMGLVSDIVGWNEETLWVCFAEASKAVARERGLIGNEPSRQ